VICYRPAWTCVHKIKHAGVDYEPIKAAVAVIESAPSSCGGTTFATRTSSRAEASYPRKSVGGLLLEGRSTEQRAHDRILSIPTTTIAVAVHLEELQSPNTTEAVISWARILGVVSPLEHDTLWLVQRDSFRFYKVHGIRHLAAFRRHTTDATMSISHARFRVGRHGVSLPQTQTAEGPLEFVCENWTELFFSQAFQLGLYHLFGYDRTIWNEAGSWTWRWEVP